MKTTSAWGSPFVCLCTKGVIAHCVGEEVGNILQPGVEGISLVCPLPNHFFNWMLAIIGDPLDESIRAVKDSFCLGVTKKNALKWIMTLFPKLTLNILRISSVHFLAKWIEEIKTTLMPVG